MQEPSEMGSPNDLTDTVARKRVGTYAHPGRLRSDNTYLPQPDDDLFSRVAPHWHILIFLDTI
jgi:hypothetical protein